MKKIVIIRPKIGFGLGGAETHSATLVKKFLEYGYKITIIANQVYLPQNIISQIKIYQIPHIGKGSLLKYLLFAKKAEKILSQLNYDYLISPFRFPNADLLILCDPLTRFWIEQKYSNKIFKKFIFFKPRYKFWLKIEKEVLKSAKKIIALFNLTKELIKKYYPFAFEKTFVCKRGIDFHRFNPELKEKKQTFRKELGFSKNDYLLLFVGKEPRRKGLNLLLKIIKHLPSNFKLLVAGIVKKSSEKIIYLGNIKNIEKYYALADIVVLPTLYDPGAMTTLEALATGTPVITSIFDGTREVIKEGINGFITNLNEKDLKEKILKSSQISFNPLICYETIKNLTWDNYVDCLIRHL